MILVTGGGGFIGSHLVQQLVDAGERVRVLEIPSADLGHLPLDRVEVVRGDIRNLDDVRGAVRECRQVYHLAANPNLWTKDPRHFEAVNHVGSRNVLEEALQAGAERVVYTSTESILVGGDSKKHKVEDLRPADEDMVGPYCLSKLKGEQEAFRLADAGAPVIIVSPTLPVGPGDHRLTPPTRMTLAFCQGKLPAYLDCEWNMIDVRDVAAGMRAAMKVGKPSVRYLLGGTNLRLIDWLKTVGQVIGRKAPRWEVPYSVALAAAYADEWKSDNVTGEMPMATVTGVKLTRFSMHFDARESRERLGMTVRPIEESARDAIAWFREKGWLEAGSH